MKRFFCRKYPLDKGVTFLMVMDLIGMVLYAGNIAGVMLALSKSTEQLYLEVAAKENYLSDMNSIVLIHSSLILAMVIIPRLFSYLYVHEKKQDYLRRHSYYLVRANTSAFLIMIQLVIVVALIYFLVKQLTDPSGTDSMLYERIIPLLAAYGTALVVTIAVDPYWTV